MVFSSHVFLFWFLPSAVAIYYLTPLRLRNLTLTVMSYGFYGWSHPYFVPLMLFSTAVDYACGLWIGRRRTKAEEAPGGDSHRGDVMPRLPVAISVISNLRAYILDTRQAGCYPSF